MKRLQALMLIVALSACTNNVQPLDDYDEVTPTDPLTAPPIAKSESTKLVERGRYMAELAGCGICHTDGAMIGEPRMDRWMAGSRVGIAYSNPLAYAHPGLLFPRNLTPDVKTGIGNWSDEEIAAKIRTGVGRHGRAEAPVMPWPAYAKLTQQDIDAIVAYLRILPSVHHEVPQRVPPGVKSKNEYVHFGVYRSKR